MISFEFFDHIISTAASSIALIICVIPESLEMSVGLSLVMQLRNKTNIVKNMAASEKIGGT